MSKRTFKEIFSRSLCAVICLFMLIALVGCGEEKDNYPTATEKLYVNDFASVMTTADSDMIYQKGSALDTATTAQAVVVTIDSTDGMEISEYALELGRKWGIGDDDKDNGVLLLLAVEDREVYIAVGYGLEGALPDSKTGRIIDTYGIPYLSNDDFSTGIVSMYTALVNEIYIEYGMTAEEGYTPISQIPKYPYEENEVSALKVGLSWLALIVFVAAYVAIFGRRGGFFLLHMGSNSFRGGGGFGGFRGGGGFGGGSFGGGSFGGGGAGRRF